MTFAVTGAGGYLGSRLTQHLRASGSRVIAMSRHPVPGAPDTATFTLGDRGPIQGLGEADVLVHCAYDFTCRSKQEIHERNVIGALRLFDAAGKAGVSRLLLISTISAFPGCKSLYGQAKLALEADVLQRGGQIVRPGLVFGPRPGGMLGRLANAVRMLPLVAVPSGGTQNLYLAHEDDVGEVVRRLVEEAPDVHGPVTAADSRPWRLKELFGVLGEAAGRRPLVIALPWRLMWGGIKTVESVGLPSPIGSDSVLSIVNQNPSPSFAEAARLGVTFRPFTADALDSARAATAEP